ncbi:class II aldolase/adducin family protein [Ideonella livida]|uniref:Aldolase n=1 Tax=Ideonella livida TaxID=2707176 RepID=A0A7C9PJ32_9BURK|nr:aldolase [Ideonella livida]NDY93196.1 aldolase [Ideonella livida]
MTTHATENALREQVCAVGASLFQRRLVHATAGNLSVRLPDGYLITPTDACLGSLDPARLAKVGPDGVQLSGDRASKTLVLHRRIYAAAPQAGCVLHTHSTHLVALTLQGVWRPAAILPPLTPYSVMKVGPVPLIPYHRPGDPRVGDLVAQAITRAAAQGVTLQAVMLDRLGPNVWADTPAAAMARLDELEETAQLWLLGGRAGTGLDAAALDELRQAFGAHWWPGSGDPGALDLCDATTPAD